MESVIKCSLRTIWECDETDRTLLIREIDKRVISVSQCTFNASVKLNHLLWRLFDNHEDVMEVNVPDVLDQTFIRQLIVGTERARKEISHLTDFNDLFPDYLPIPTYYSNTRNIYTHAAIQYKTNIMNHFTTNFGRFQKRYHTILVHQLNGGKDDLIALQCATNNWEPSYDVYPMRKEVYDLVQEHRRILCCEDYISETWIKQNISSCIRYFVIILRCIQSMPRKRFSLVPIRKIGRSFITIDTTTMTDIVCKVLRLSKTYDSKDWLKVDSMVGKNRQFTGTLSTDGISVCVHFQDVKNRVNKVCTHTNVNNYERILGVDPGRINIYTVVEKQDDGSYSKRTFTRRRYYEESGINKANRNCRQWNEVHQDIYDLLASNSPKVATVEKFDCYYKVIKKYYETLWYEKLKKKWAEQSFRLYGGKKRSFANFWKSYQSDKKTLLAYGAARFPSSKKGELASPTTKAFREASSQFRAVLVNEFRSTVIHHECNQQMQLVQSQKRKNTVHGLHWCCSPNCCKFVDRDLNAAINILLNVVDKENRPEIFSRRTPKLPKMETGRRIYA